MRRRAFIASMGAAGVAWRRIARAQAAIPTVGVLGLTAPDRFAIRLGAFLEGLRDAGYIEGRNVSIEYRWADGHNERMPALAAELAGRQVAVIAAVGGTPAALAAKVATSTIPIVFEVGIDPVEAGLVASLSRPGGNATGVTNLNVEIAPKRLELLRELLPKAKIIGVLYNPTNGVLSERYLHAMRSTAEVLSIELHPFQASTDADFDVAFSALARLHADALEIASDQFLASRIEELAIRAFRQQLPAIYQYRKFTASGGLMSYGGSETDNYRLVGIQVARILDGAKPSELPVAQSKTVELILNVKTAKAFGIEIPHSLLARADEVIE